MESRDHKTIRYILCDEDLLFVAGCEWLSGRHVAGLIPCARSVQNGKIRLTYEIGGLTALSDCAASHSTQLCRHVLQDLLRLITDVRNVGFLRGELISLNPERIFVDPRDNGIRLIYLPLVVERDGSGLPLIEKNLNKLFEQIFSINPRLKEEPEPFDFRSALLDPQVNWETVHQKESTGFAETAQKIRFASVKEWPGQLPEPSNLSGSADTGQFLSRIMSSDQQFLACENNQNNSTGEKAGWRRASTPARLRRSLIACLPLIGGVAMSVSTWFQAPIAYRPRVFLVIGMIVVSCVIAALLFLKSKKKSPVNGVKAHASAPFFHSQSGGEQTELLDNLHEPRLILSAIDSATPFHVILDNDESVVGKDRLACDAVIDFNPAISRRHCKVTRRGARHYIVDLNSSNGTYVNDLRLSPDREQSIRVGDQIKLANSRFILKSRSTQNDIIKQ